MRKLVLSSAALAALMVGPATAADLVVRPYRAPHTVTVNPLWPFGTARQGPIGVAGARWGNLCWVDSDSGRYAGYWRPCPRPAARPARVASRNVRAPIVAKY
jgi:hypothetical protein